MRSLRARLVLGSVLWMLAVLFVLNVLTISFARRHPLLQTRAAAHMTAMASAFIAFLGGGIYLVARSLKPFRRLRERLADVRAGRETSVLGTFPTEVQPVVDDLNALLDDRERAVTRALGTAGDLAHGLKTPLAVLTNEARHAEAAGHHELAATIRQQVERMRRQVDYHLAHARATASAGVAPGLRCYVLASAEGLARTMLRIHAARGLDIEVRVAAEHAIRGRREDLDEMLGNLLDNACKWARSCVVVASSRSDESISITVDDDGPGLDPSLRDVVLQRGVRADEAAPGSGLGLAIVSDLVELYRGSIALESSPQGGVRARLELPAAETVVVSS